MPTKHEDLKKNVVAKFAESGAMREALERNCIYWRTPVVGIQDILMETPPQKMARTFTGARFMTDEEYAPIFENWKKNMVGGSQKLRDDHKGKYWNPPEGARLYILQQIKHDWNTTDYAFFLLEFEDKHHFLAMRFGNDNDLRVLGDNDDEIHFDTALRNALAWTPGCTEN